MNQAVKTSPLKVALVVKSLDPDRGGHENYMNRLIRGLLAREHQIWCFAEGFGTRSIEHPKLTKVKVPPFKLSSSLRILWFNYKAQRLVRNHPVEFDLVFTTGNVTFGDIHRAGGGVHATYMETCLGPVARLRPRNLVARRLQERLFRENTKCQFITNSQMVMNDIQRRYGVPPKRIQVVRNGIDLERFNPEVAAKTRDEIRHKHGFAESDFVCLFTAAGGSRKGLAELLRSLSLIKNAAIKLLIVGRTNEASLQQMLETHSLEKRVVYAGFQRKIEQYYGAADCFVFPSKYDAAANVVCEALATGNPVITTQTNGSSELVVSGRNGFVIPKASDYNAVREHLETLFCCDSGKKKEIHQHASETCRGFTMDRHVVKMEAAFRQCKARPNQRSTSENR